MSPDEESGRYFAFVNFESHEAAAAACKALHEKEVEGGKLYVDRAQTKAERQGILQRRHEQKRSQMAQLMEGKNVYVKNLAASIDEAALETAFSVWFFRRCCVRTGVHLLLSSSCSLSLAEVW